MVHEERKKPLDEARVRVMFCSISCLEMLIKADINHGMTECDLPDDTRIVRVWQQDLDDWDKRFRILVTSQQFTPVPPGGPIPEISPTYTRKA